MREATIAPKIEIIKIDIKYNIDGTPNIPSLIALDFDSVFFIDSF